MQQSSILRQMLLSAGLLLLASMTSVLGSQTIDDRGEYHGKGRDTKGAVRLLRAGDWTTEGSSGEYVTICRDNVKFIQDSITIWCDEARHWERKQLLMLQGRVVIMEPTRRLDADMVTYDAGVRKTIAQGNFKVTRDSVILTSRQGRYEERGDVATVQKSIVLDDLRRKIRLTGDYGVWYLKEEKGMVPADPILTKLDTIGALETRIIADTMEYNVTKGYAEAISQVVLTWDDVKGWCDKLYYYPDNRKALLIGHPRVLRERDEALGDSIWIYFTEQQIDSLEVFGKALLYTPSDSSKDSPRSVMEGFRIALDFEKKQVVRIQSDRQAIGIYHIFENGIDKGSNRVSGDQIILFVKDGQLDNIKVEGGTQGTYYPPELAKEIRSDE